jgi:hypothetical protein
MSVLGKLFSWDVETDAYFNSVEKLIRHPNTSRPRRDPHRHIRRSKRDAEEGEGIPEFLSPPILFLLAEPREFLH